MRSAPFLFLCALLWPSLIASAGDERPSWERAATGLDDIAFFAVAVDPARPDRIMAASRHRVYESTDGGQSWHARFRVPGSATISGLAVGPALQPVTLVATDHGLYGSFDGGARWSRVFRGPGLFGDAQCTTVAFHPRRHNLALLGTRDGLFLSSDDGRHWKPVAIPSPARNVVRAAFAPHDPARVYLLAAQGLFIGDVNGGSWRRCLSALPSEDPGSETGTGSDGEGREADDQEPLAPRLSTVVLDPEDPSRLYLAGTRGLAVSADGGTSWRRMTRVGLASPAISRLVLSHHSPLVIYAATPRGVARYAPARERWQVMSQGLVTSRIHDLALAGDVLWAATDQGLYHVPVAPDLFSDSEPPSAREFLAEFAHEPTITQVREAAIRYAEVHPDKIRQWRRQAALKALLPTVDIGMDHNQARHASVDEGTFPRFQIIETDTHDARLDVSVKWELGDLIWNDDQTTIDVRSKLMVQLRNDLVDEVTRTYFERRRLQVMLLTGPPQDQQEVVDKELRLQELTALLDGLTGGYFSQQMEIVQAGSGG